MCEVLPSKCLISVDRTAATVNQPSSEHIAASPSSTNVQYTAWHFRVSSPLWKGLCAISSLYIKMFQGSS